MLAGTVDADPVAGRCGALVGLFGRIFKTTKSTPHSAAPWDPGDEQSSEPVFAVIDIETTGLSPRQDRIVELAVVRLDHRGSIVDEWSTRFNPEGPVGATHIHGITEADVARAPLFREQSHALAGLLRSTTVVAHNARFDLAFLRAEYERSGWDLPLVPAYCTLQGSHHYLPWLERRRLADCCAATGVRLDRAHSALGDARATGHLMNRYLSMPHVPVHPDLSQVRTDARDVIWPDGPTRRPRTTPLERRPNTVGAQLRRTTPRRQRQGPLVGQLTNLGLTELLDDGAPEGTLPYLELLLEVLEDGVMTEEEAGALADLIEAYELGSDEVASAHHAFVTALAHRALDDGHVSRDERAELSTIAEILDVEPMTLRRIISHADEARAARLSADLRPLPDDWSLGEPLRVGDKVVFTGCDEVQRNALEKRAEELGVRVMGKVSRTTVMLVTDGTFAGGKAAKASELGTRTVHPDQFDVLLTYLQPKSTTGESDDTTGSTSAASPTRTDHSPAAIRRWARQQGYEVSDRGRVPRSLIEAHARARADQD
ncbi:exonuclease domain-containing protein [Isoptericola sediminis]|uniref:Exonuclease domain-containing protein n=1 Tax=Isoptericola sediminis TaxID=2733572 RepID=A0A849K5T0_9MICO|nr:histone-like nucleoid-structuring protein Lsr2 [Isoptericola sediminis]NNU27780.1 hypothetical protein [Isoptericola sediminis]